MPELSALFGSLEGSEIERRCVKAGLPFAFVAHPEDLFDDPHLNANGSLAETVLPGGIASKVPLLPVRIDGEAFPLRDDPPSVGEDTKDILASLKKTKR